MATIFRPPILTKWEQRKPLSAGALDTGSNGLLPNLQGKDVFYAGAGQSPPQRDWPVPKGYLYPVSLRTWTISANVSLLESSPDSTFRAPVSSPRTVPRFLPVDQINNLLTTTLGGTTPFAQLNWTNPLTQQFPSHLRTYLNAVEIQLIGADTFFGLAGAPNFDWPVPKGPSHPITNKTHLDPLKLLLNGKDQFFAAAGMGPAYDYPNPRGYAPLNRSFTYPTQIHLTDTFFGLAGHPNFDWPNPRGYVQPVHNKTHLDPLKLNLLGQDQFFAAAGMGPVYDYPNPLAPRRNPSDWLLSSDIPLFTAVVYYPFSLTDQPNPRGYVHPTSLRTHTHNVGIHLTDTFFGLAGHPTFDFPNPRGYSPLNRGFTQSLNTNLQVVYAFTQLDWPVPPGYRYPSHLRTHLHSTDLTLIGKDAIAFRQLDWPVPRGPRQYPRNLLSISNSPPTITTIAVAITWGYTIPDNQPQYAIPHNIPNYVVPDNKLHFTFDAGG